MIQLSSLSTPLFFVDNIPDLQFQCMKLLPIIFAKSKFLRKNILMDLLNSLHRLPSNRNNKNSYRLGTLNNTEFISNFSALVLLLIQSTVKVIAFYKFLITNFSCLLGKDILSLMMIWIIIMKILKLLIILL